MDVRWRPQVTRLTSDGPEAFVVFNPPFVKPVWADQRPRSSTGQPAQDPVGAR